jgi:hypothetical protein
VIGGLPIPDEVVDRRQRVGFATAKLGNQREDWSGIFGFRRNESARSLHLLHRHIEGVQ